jgi:Putative DNA-binding domain
MTVPSLAEVQARLRDAVVIGAASDVLPLLVGGKNPAARLAVHSRHYAASLAEAVLRRFPGVTWLVGEPFMSAVAKDFVRRHPPTAPCIAEYAEGIPDFLAQREGLETMPFVGWFARLEWRVGRIAIDVDRAPVDIDALSAFGLAAVPDLVLRMQTGLCFLEAPWPVDTLFGLYLSEAAPDHFTMESIPVRLQVRGARGRFRIDRLDAGTFVFRNAVAGGLPVGEAAERALDLDPAFDPGQALAALVADGLVASVTVKT